MRSRSGGEKAIAAAVRVLQLHMQAIEVERCTGIGDGEVQYRQTAALAVVSIRHQQPPVSIYAAAETDASCRTRTEKPQRSCGLPNNNAIDVQNPAMSS